MFYLTLFNETGVILFSYLSYLSLAQCESQFNIHECDNLKRSYLKRPTMCLRRTFY